MLIRRSIRVFLTLSVLTGCGVLDREPPVNQAILPPDAPPASPAVPPAETSPAPTPDIDLGQPTPTTTPSGPSVGVPTPSRDLGRPPVTPWRREAFEVAASESTRYLVTTNEVVGLISVSDGLLAIGASGGMFLAANGSARPLPTQLPAEIVRADRVLDTIVVCPAGGDGWVSVDDGRGWAQLDFPCGDGSRRTVASGHVAYALLPDGRLRIGQFPRGVYVRRAIPIRGPRVVAARDDAVVVFGEDAAAWSTDRGTRLAAVTLPPQSPAVRDAVLGPKGLIVAVGDGPSALVSNDGGRSWRLASLPRRAESLDRIDIDGQGRILATSTDPDGVAVLSVNGGRTWQSVGVRGQFRGGVVGQAAHFEVAARRGVFGRVDGVGARPLGLDQPLFAATFVHPRLGYGIGTESGIYRTEDGGARWAAIPSAQSLQFAGIDADDQGTVYAVGPHSFWRGDAQGRRWSSHVPPPDCAPLWLRAQPRGNTILVGCEGGAWLRSEDRGTSWNMEVGLAEGLQRPVWTGPERVTALSESGRYLFGSANGGRSWFARPTPDRDPPVSLAAGGDGVSLAWADGRVKTALWVVGPWVDREKASPRGALLQHRALRGGGVLALDEAGVVHISSAGQTARRAPEGFGMSLVGDGGLLVMQPRSTAWFSP